MKGKIARKLIYLGAALLICAAMVLFLNGCSRDASDDDGPGSTTDETDEEKEQSQEAASWSYDGGETVIPGEKSEIVTASADATGDVYKILSAVTISEYQNSDGSDSKESSNENDESQAGGISLPIKDVSNLTNIKNRNGAEEFDYRESEGFLYWENRGSSIQYEGEGVEELPVELKITYYLNDREVTPEEIAGKSGHVKVRIDYINKTYRTVKIDGTEYSVPVPFAVITAILLPEGTLKNFESDGARLSKISSQDVVMGMTLPGVYDALNLGEKDFAEDIDLPSYMEFEADTDEFRIDFSTTIMQNGLLDEDEDNSEDKDDIQELIDSVQDLKRATNSLVNGADSLLSGEKQLKDGIEKYLDGVSSVSSGASSLYDGVKTLNDNGQSLVDGANSLKEGASQMSQAISSYAESLESQLSGGGDSGQTGGSSAIDSIPDISVNITIPEDLPEEQKQELEAIKASMEAQAQQLSTVKQSLKSAAEQVESGRQALINAQNQVKNALLPTVQGLSSQLAALSEGASQLSQGIEAYAGGVSQLENGAKGLKDGASQLAGQNKTIKDGMASLEDGISSFKSGLIKYRDEGINEIASFVEGDLADLNNRTKALREADKSYGSYSGADKSADISVTYIIETDFPT